METKIVHKLKANGNLYTKLRRTKKIEFFY